MNIRDHRQRNEKITEFLENGLLDHILNFFHSNNREDFEFALFNSNALLFQQSRKYILSSQHKKCIVAKLEELEAIKKINEFGSFEDVVQRYFNILR